MDLRERVVAACGAGQSQAEVARRFSVCSKTVERYVALAKAGQLAPRPLPGRAPRVSADQHEALRALVQEDPNRTLAQMSLLWQERTGQVLSTSTLPDALKRVGGRFKKNTLGRGAE